MDSPLFDDSCMMGFSVLWDHPGAGLPPRSLLDTLHLASQTSKERKLGKNSIITLPSFHSPEDNHITSYDCKRGWGM